MAIATLDQYIAAAKQYPVWKKTGTRTLVAADSTAVGLPDCMLEVAVN